MVRNQVQQLRFKPFAKKIARDIQKWSADAVNYQERIFQNLIAVGKNTAFGKDHNFSEIKSYQDFCERVSIRDYEALKPYIERIRKGEKDIEKILNRKYSKYRKSKYSSILVIMYSVY